MRHFVILWLVLVLVAASPPPRRPELAEGATPPPPATCNRPASDMPPAPDGCPDWAPVAPPPAPIPPPCVADASVTRWREAGHPVTEITITVDHPELCPTPGPGQACMGYIHLERDGDQPWTWTDIDAEPTCAKDEAPLAWAALQILNTCRLDATNIYTAPLQSDFIQALAEAGDCDLSASLSPGRVYLPLVVASGQRQPPTGEPLISWPRSPIVTHAGTGQSCPRVLINEVVTDPQQDWDDSAGGDGIPFNATPGAGSITSSDEWTELLNVSDRVLNLIDWRLVMTDTTPATEVLGVGSAALRFSHGGSLSHFQPGERLVIGNPAGSMNNDVYLQLLDAAGQLIDDVEIGDDFEEDGIDGAPLTGENGNADSLNDEAIARAPDGIDTDDDVADFTRQRATLGRSNGHGSLSVTLPALNTLGPDEGGCDAFITVQNVGITTTKAILLTWDSAGACPPRCNGPSQVECSGLIQPGAAWQFRPTNAQAGIVFSVSAATWPLRHGDDVFADALCNILDDKVVGDCDEYRRFKRAFDGRTKWRRRGPDPDFGPFAGEPIAAHVLRRCQTEGAAITSSYTAPDRLTQGRRDPDFGGFAYHAPALYADRRGMNSTIYLQNAGLECTGVELWFRGENECLRSQICDVPALAPGESYPLDVSACAGPDWRGSAWVRAGQPLAIAVDNYSPDILMTYTGRPAELNFTFSPDTPAPDQPCDPFFTPGSQVNYAPLIYREFQGWDTTLWVQNLSSTVNAKVKVIFLDSSGGIITTLTDWICPRGSRTYHLSLIANLPGQWVGSARVESQDWFSAGSLSVPTSNIVSVAELVRYSDPTHATPLEGLAYPLLTEAEAFDWQLGPPAQPLCPGPGCIGQLALPAVSESDTSTTEIAIQNLVPQAGLTNAAVFLYDQNGLLDVVCEALNEQQVDYIDLAGWGYVNPGFRGSVVISATAWDHPAFDPAGRLKVNPVGLAGVIIERDHAGDFDTPGDSSAGSVAFPLTTPTDGSESRCANPPLSSLEHSR